MPHILELRRALSPWLLALIATVLFGPLLLMVVLVSRFPQVGVVHSRLRWIVLAWPMMGLWLIVAISRLERLRVYGFQLQVESSRLVLVNGKSRSAVELDRPHCLMAILKDSSAQSVGLNVWLEVSIAQGETRFSFAELWVQPDAKAVDSQRNWLVENLSLFSWVVPEADLHHTMWRFLELRPQMQFLAATVPWNVFVKLLSLLDAHRAHNRLLPWLSVARGGGVSLREL